MKTFSEFLIKEAEETKFEALLVKIMKMEGSDKFNKKTKYSIPGAGQVPNYFTSASRRYVGLNIMNNVYQTAKTDKRYFKSVVIDGTTYFYVFVIDSNTNVKVMIGTEKDGKYVSLHNSKINIVNWNKIVKENNTGTRFFVNGVDKKVYAEIEKVEKSILPDFFGKIIFTNGSEFDMMMHHGGPIDAYNDYHTALHWVKELAMFKNLKDKISDEFENIFEFENILNAIKKLKPIDSGSGSSTSHAGYSMSVKTTNTLKFNIGTLLKKYSEFEIEQAATAFFTENGGKTSVTIDGKTMIVVGSKTTHYD